MSNNVKIHGFSFYINTPVQVSGEPEKQSVLNQFDLLGDMVSLRRISGESNADYKQRIMDVSVHPGGPTYSGVINNLTRDLGFSRENAVLIQLNLDSSGNPVASNPRVDVLPNRVVLYSDWRPDGTEVIDIEVRTYQTDDTGYFVSDLVAAINTSTCFTASLYSGIRPNLHSSNLLMSSSGNVVRGDVIAASTFTDLSAENIIQNSLSFDEVDIFKTEVLSAPTSSGEYMIDYINGKVYTYDVPSGLSGVYYHHGIFPMTIDYSPIRIYSLHEDDFTDELFHMETLDSGEEVKGLPNTEGSEIYHALFKEVKVFWGE